ncbi:MAG: polysaccharide pyruvyl transferase family protein [Oscillospiraceae bacterium]|nr:polysaccharide pyruvyl transferase family protein [Oscillospiraceae bacterium]
MKKVGILSMQRIVNYGSFMQAFALKNMIENEGCSVQFVDYKVEPCLVEPSPARKEKSLTKGQLIAAKVRWHIMHAVRTLRGNEVVYSDECIRDMNNKYDEFKAAYNEKYLRILGISNERNERPSLDTLVIGSDEVFNCLQTNPDVGYSKELFGYSNNAQRLISYAASFGNTTSEGLEKYSIDTQIKQMLGNFDSISVRDTNSGKIVKQLTGCEPEYNLDPVLMYDFTSHIPKIDTPDNYIVVYAYKSRISLQEAREIRMTARKMNKKLICIGGPQYFCDDYIACDPFTVLAYFKGADYIITDTFHGSIFSVICNKKFAVLIRKSIDGKYGNEEKIGDLLRRLKLEKQTVPSLDSLRSVLEQDIDYETTNRIISEERVKAREYLKNNL